MTTGSLGMVLFRICFLLIFQVSQIYGYDYMWDGSGKNVDNTWMRGRFKPKVEMTNEKCFKGRKISFTCSPSVIGLSKEDVDYVVKVNIARPPITTTSPGARGNTNKVAAIDLMSTIYPLTTRIFNSFNKPWSVEFQNVPFANRTGIEDIKEHLKDSHSMSITWTIEVAEAGTEGLYLCEVDYTKNQEDGEPRLFEVGGHQRIGPCANATTNINKPPHVHRHGDAAKLGASFVLPILLVILLTLRPLFD